MKITKPKPVNQQVYDYLFNQIIEGTLPAGTRLSEDKISEQMGVSRTPVRESILKLEHEGLLRNKCVIEPTLQEINECYEVRILLESYAAKKAATIMSTEEKSRLKELLVSAKDSDFGTAMKAHTEFHNTIVRACGNTYIAQQIERLQAIIMICRQDIVRNRPELAHEHDLIYEAIFNGDEDLAESIMKQHLLENHQKVLSRLSVVGANV
ncbi:GntR family transcriptional regulator (plasmid) [Alicyclobacillus fastidiosus]|uniref:GntR family transcriptional regulator n=1 Tax=Alicyclobacillus fastidiosus TaxID=392011 RepID=A0ABY6ZQ22_9BACL|nr:GntR family transcriptional regulator [Alicyclobacillus fastidiosus]WAH44942.1 GntR family transcriptional regulator [Alicyclobacillus fastidiosus]GMA65595.1 GntR family transcriptional regulator [Alicyclobacillus fastidiosus]GMA65711.1 GntR family transcriptional regulator [Alicyclobacillus fastidiosus]